MIREPHLTILYLDPMAGPVKDEAYRVAGTLRGAYLRRGQCWLRCRKAP